MTTPCHIYMKMLCADIKKKFIHHLHGLIHPLLITTTTTKATKMASYPKRRWEKGGINKTRGKKETWKFLKLGSLITFFPVAWVTRSTSTIFFYQNADNKKKLCRQTSKTRTRKRRRKKIEMRGKFIILIVKIGFQ